MAHMKTIACLLLLAVAGAAAKPKKVKATAVEEPAFPNVVEFLTSAEAGFNFSQLVKHAEENIPLVTDLDSDSWVGTVFAPTDEAFAAAIAQVEALGIPLTNELIDKVLAFHIVNGTALDADELAKAKKVETLLGANLKFKKDGKKVYVLDKAGQEIAIVDSVKAGDAWVHVIKSVAFPLDPATLLPSVSAPAPAPAEPAPSSATSVMASAAALAASALAAFLLA